MATTTNPMVESYWGSDNPWIDFLDFEPSAAYYSSPSGWTAPGAFGKSTPGARRYYQNQFQNVYNEFLGTMGTQVREGGRPTMRFGEFLENIPWAERYAALTPEMAGRTTRRFSPGTRQIYF